MKKKVLIISLAALLFLLALGLTLYPLIANRYHQRHQSEIHTAYQEQVAQADKTEIIAAREKAIAYNETLVSGVQAEDAVSHRRERSPGLNASHSSGRGALS